MTSGQLSFRRCIPGAGAILLLAISAMAESFDAKATFYNQDVLGRALEEIGQMEEPELRTFAHYLAQCDDELVDVPTRHACSTAQKTYSIEFGGKRALDDMILARSSLNLKERIEPEPFDAGDIIKHTMVINSLEVAARKRFQTLKSSRAH